MTCSGQRRSGRLMAGKGRYLWIGILGIKFSWSPARDRMRWLCFGHREASRSAGSSSPTGAKSAPETQLRLARDSAEERKNVMHVEKGHIDTSERECSQTGNGATAEARRSSERRAAKSKLVALAMHRRVANRTLLRGQPPKNVA